MISSSWGRAKTTAFFPRYSLAPLRMASQCLSERFWIDALKMLACFVSFRFFFPSASTVSVGMLPQFTWEKWDSFPPFGALNSPVTENKSVRWTCNKFFQVSYGSGNESTSTLTAWTAYIKAPWGFMEIVWMSSTSTVDMSARWSASVLRTIRQRNKRDGERRKTPEIHLAYSLLQDLETTWARPSSSREMGGACEIDRAHRAYARQILHAVLSLWDHAAHILRPTP